MNHWTLILARGLSSMNLTALGTSIVAVVATLGCGGRYNPTGGGATGASSGSSIAGCNLTASASVSGTLLGKSLTPRDAFTIQDATAGMFMTSIGIVDYGQACMLNPVQSVKAGSRILVLRFSGAAALGAGAFTVPSTVNAQYASYDQACVPTGESADSGSVHVAHADACGISGTFDLLFSADHVTGTFVAPLCNLVRTDGGQCL